MVGTRKARRVKRSDDIVDLNGHITNPPRCEHLPPQAIGLFRLRRLLFRASAVDGLHEAAVPAMTSRFESRDLPFDEYTASQNAREVVLLDPLLGVQNTRRPEQLARRMRRDTPFMRYTC